MNQYAKYAKLAQKFAVDNSNTILSAIAVTGVVTTTVLAVKATPAAYTDIQHAESERIQPLTRTEKVRLCWKYYVPATATGVATIACIVGANTVSTRRAAALASAYSLSENAFKDFREKAVEKFGDGKIQQVRDEIAQDRVTAQPPVDGQIIMTGKGDALFMDSYTGRYFETTMEDVRKAENDINRQMHHEMYASLNDFYECLGLDKTKVGAELGWTVNIPLELEFSTTLAPNGKAAIVIDYRVEPNKGFHKFG